MIGAHEGQLLTLDGASWNTVSTAALGDSIRSVTYWESQGLAIVVQKKLDAAALVNVETGAIVARIGIDTDPDRAAVDNSSKAYVTTKDDLGINRIDLATRRSEGRYILPTEASAIAFDPAAQLLYVTQPKDKSIVRLDPGQNFVINSITLAKRLRDITVNNATHQAAAIAEKSNELTRIRLADQSFETLALPEKPSKIGVDSTRNLAVISFKDELRFVNLGASPAALYVERIDAGDEIKALAVDSVRGLTLVATKGNAPLAVIDNATRTKVASIASSEKLVT
ncbi:MAG: hypothetical protein NTZ61_04430, partial [Proteobacteria bacterium]|nr:hypothetical protein [Pseudomonadota bacterium]